MGPWSGRPQESSQAAAGGPGKRHGEVPGSILSDPVPLVDHRCMLLTNLGIGSPWGDSLSCLKVRFRDVARAEATPVS